MEKKKGVCGIRQKKSPAFFLEKRQRKPQAVFVFFQKAAVSFGFSERTPLLFSKTYGLNNFCRKRAKPASDFAKGCVLTVKL